MGDLIHLDDYRQHKTRFMLCGICGYEWQAVYPAFVKALECPHCRHMVMENGEPKEQYMRRLLNYVDNDGEET